MKHVAIIPSNFILFLTRYKQDFVQEMEDISHPVFVATALYTACKYDI